MIAVGTAPMLERDKPGTLVFLAYANEDGTEADVVHVFPDAEAMARHLEGASERAAASMKVIETIGYEIYGSPSEPVLETMRGFATTSGADLRVRPDHLGGYLRPGRDRTTESGATAMSGD